MSVADLWLAEDICRGLLIEDPAKEKLRRELLVKREQLIQAIRQLSKHVA